MARKTSGYAGPTIGMTPSEVREAHGRLGLTADGAAHLFRVGSGRTVRGWWSGSRNGRPCIVPGPVVVLTRALLESRDVRRYFGLSLPEDPPSGSGHTR